MDMPGFKLFVPDGDGEEFEEADRRPVSAAGDQGGDGEFRARDEDKRGLRYRHGASRVSSAGFQAALPAFGTLFAPISLSLEQNQSGRGRRRCRARPGHFHRFTLPGSSPGVKATVKHNVPSLMCGVGGEPSLARLRPWGRSPAGRRNSSSSPLSGHNGLIAHASSLDHIGPLARTVNAGVTAQTPTTFGRFLLK
jgi:hypothetical protein